MKSSNFSVNPSINSTIIPPVNSAIGFKNISKKFLPASTTASNTGVKNLIAPLNKSKKLGNKLSTVNFANGANIFVYAQ